MNWWTFGIAVWGAVTGTYGAVIATLGRVDGRWRRRAKQIPEVRPALVALRDAVAEGRRGTRGIQSLRDNVIRAELDVIQEIRPSLSDGKLKDQLLAVDHAYTAILALGDSSTDHKTVSALEGAASAIEGALARVAEIQRKALP